MSGKCRLSLREKTLYNVMHSALSVTDKECVKAVFERFDKGVKHGKWETIPDYSQALISYRHICSECKTFYKDIRPYGHNYCPNCGAKMDGKEENDAEI